jgi:mono/diheme cytochrome c family protein
MGSVVHSGRFVGRRLLRGSSVVTASAAIGSLLLVGLMHAADARAQAPAAAGGNAANGRAMFAKAGCETCHGAEGRGTAAGPALAGTPRQLPAFVQYVRKPAGTMPPVGVPQVSDQALADIHAFLRGITGAPAPAATAAQAPPGRVEAGGALYTKVGCFQCHGNEGQGGLSGPRIAPNPVPFARFQQYLRQPSGDMPPYTDKVLSSQDLADIYAYMQARRQPPAANTIPQLAP